MVKTEIIISTPLITGHISSLLVIIAFMLAVVKKNNIRTLYRLYIVGISVLISEMSFNGISLTKYLWGVLGSLSTTTMLLLLCFIYQKLFDKKIVTNKNLNFLMLLVVTGAIVLYPLSLGLYYTDPYLAGYGSFLFILSLFIICIFALNTYHYPALLCICFAAISYSFEIMESRNLWDYLIDPLLVFFAIFWLAKQSLIKATAYFKLKKQQTK